MAKRQKTFASGPQPRCPSNVGSLLDDDYVHKQLSKQSPTMPHNMQLKGRKRFIVDLSEVIASGTSLQAQGLRVQSVRQGDEEGSFCCEFVKTIGEEHVISLNFLVSDTSDYPSEHSFFCFAYDEDVPPQLLNCIQTVAEQGSCLVDDILRIVLTLCAKALASSERSDESESEDTMDEDDEDIEMFDEDYDFDDEDVSGIEAPRSRSDCNNAMLLRDFHEVIAACYRPGSIRLGIDELVLSVSIPSFHLADTISARALMAWDPRLLTTGRHLCLLISGIRAVYPVLSDNGALCSALVSQGFKLQFKVGLSKQYKPPKEDARELVRNFSLKDQTPKPSSRFAERRTFFSDSEEDEGYESVDFHADYRGIITSKTIVSEGDLGFIPFSLSSSLESLLNDCFMDILRYRLEYSIGWAAAEVLALQVHRTQKSPSKVLEETPEIVLAADADEDELSHTYNLPPDPLSSSDRGDHLNLPLLAFTYLLRRLMLCSRHCLICYRKIKIGFQALKPYVCDDKLCTYQYYSLNRGPSLEYEICTRPEAVDLLVSLAYSAAAEASLEDFPDGMNLLVPHPQKPKDPYVEFDTLTKEEKRLAITKLLDTLPPISDIKSHLESTQRGGAKPRLQDIDPELPAAAWSVLRWCVASCTAHIEELKEEEDRLGNIGPSWRQFRFTVGAPDAEAKFYAEQQKACLKSANAREYPSLYAFHGSPVKNWHSIIRHGLWYKTIANGRAYGDGVYFAKDGTVSMSHYAGGARAAWPNSSISVNSCVALAEIINLPQEFRSSNPFFVVPQTHWIVCRYLLVNAGRINSGFKRGGSLLNVPTVKLDPQYPVTISQKHITIPEPSYKLQTLLDQRRAEYYEDEHDEEDAALFAADVETLVLPPTSQVEDDWEHDSKWVLEATRHLLPAPIYASPSATAAVQKELKALLKEQESAMSLNALGWYMPPDLIGDNLFQWVVELHSFEPNLPIAQDMVSCKVNSIVFEIRFPDDYPHSPPFFRILKPRFLPFSNGGGGHVTAGGSICMDLLTADGWLPSYSIAAVLLQIKLAISNLDPRPARLAPNWNVAYDMLSALEGYKRAANAHGWKIPSALTRMIF